MTHHVTSHLTSHLQYCITRYDSEGYVIVFFRTHQKIETDSEPIDEKTTPIYGIMGILSTFIYHRLVNTYAAIKPSNLAVITVKHILMEADLL